MEYCYECDKDVKIHYQNRIYLFEIDGIHIEFVDLVAICNKCEAEVYIMDLHDKIIKKANSIYMKKREERDGAK